MSRENPYSANRLGDDGLRKRTNYGALTPFLSLLCICIVVIARVLINVEGTPEDPYLYSRIAFWLTILAAAFWLASTGLALANLRRWRGNSIFSLVVNLVAAPVAMFF